MKPVIKVIRKSELVTSRWSGGTTTQLAIWPEGAVYADRNFVWRVSSARVEAEESDFTPLAGVSRVIMVLDGELLLRHEGLYEKRLGRFGQDSFDGRWKTTSRGCVTDFNLMTTSGEGSVEALEIASGESMAVSDADGGEWGCVSEVFYCYSGAVEIAIAADRREALDAGDVLVVVSCGAASGRLTIDNASVGSSTVIRATVRHNR
ncbi:HutD family protein [Alistipes sp. OttesenSCG-928-B03]|nr:HutD family protein [Alistipes sp. OttesenSCG-928-B03]